MFLAFIYSMEFLKKMWNSLLQLFSTVLPDYIDVYLKHRLEQSNASPEKNKAVVCIQSKDFWVMFFYKKKILIVYWMLCCLHESDNCIWAWILHQSDHSIEVCWNNQGIKVLSFMPIVSWN